MTVLWTGAFTVSFEKVTLEYEAKMVVMQLINASLAHFVGIAHYRGIAEHRMLKLTS
ncbi:hypothetical protein ACFL45_02715 [Candidatus Neomarinimicrobiota bacterium]